MYKTLYLSFLSFALPSSLFSLSSSYKESSVEAEGDNKMAAGDGAALPQEEDNREKIDRVRHIAYLLLFYRFIIIFRFYLKDLGQLVVIKLLIYYFL